MAYTVTTMLSAVNQLTVITNTTAAFTATRHNYYIFTASSAGTPIASVTSTNGITFTKLAEVGMSSVWGGLCDPGQPNQSGTISFVTIVGSVTYTLEQINGAVLVPVNSWTASATSTTVAASSSNNVLWMVGSNGAAITGLMSGWTAVTNLGTNPRALMSGFQRNQTTTAGFSGTSSTPNIVAIEFQPDFSYGSNTP